MITVNFRTATGPITTRQWPKATGVSIYGKTAGAVGLGEPGTGVRLEIPELHYLAETRTNFWGDYDFYFRTPDRDGTLTLLITATFSVAGQERLSIPVAIGTVTPEPLPAPPASQVPDFGKYLLWGGLIYLAIVAAPLLTQKSKE